MSILYSFKSLGDGANPNSSLVIDDDGSLYDTTAAGGTSDSFTCGHDGANPVSSLIMDRERNLYGMTEAGGIRVGAASQPNRIGSDQVAARRRADGPLATAARRRLERRPDRESPPQDPRRSFLGNRSAAAESYKRNGQDRPLDWRRRARYSASRSAGSIRSVSAVTRWTFACQNWDSAARQEQTAGRR